MRNMRSVTRKPPTTLMVAVTMAITPLLLIAYDRMIVRKLEADPEEPEFDEIESGETPVIIVGYGRFGMTVGRLLAANGGGRCLAGGDRGGRGTRGDLGGRGDHGDVVDF